MPDILMAHINKSDKLSWITYPCQSVQTQALIIYHELTHKILGTLDKGLGFLGDGTIGTKPIFGEDSVQQMAKDFPEKTLLVADCWANFVIYFGE
jgi:hypothetical protein